jgi:hypothetical protein
MAPSRRGAAAARQAVLTVSRNVSQASSDDAIAGPVAIMAAKRAVAARAQVEIGRSWGVMRAVLRKAVAEPLSVNWG